MPTASRIPGKGDSTDLFQRLSDYVSYVDSGWIDRIKPATEENIERLYAVSGVESGKYAFPESYRVFLWHLGENDGGLFESVGIETDVSGVVEYYQDELEFEPEAINPRMPIFGLFVIGEQLAFDLDTVGEPPVVETSSGEKIGVFCESFEKLLLQTAFVYCEKRRFPQRVSYGGNAIMLREVLDRIKAKDLWGIVEQHAKDHGFEQPWFGDQFRYLGVRDDAAFAVRHSTENTVTLWVSGNDLSFIEKFGNELSQYIGTRRT